MYCIENDSSPAANGSVGQTDSNFMQRRLDAAKFLSLLGNDQVDQDDQVNLISECKIICSWSCLQITQNELSSTLSLTTAGTSKSCYGCLLYAV